MMTDDDFTFNTEFLGDFIDANEVRTGGGRSTKFTLKDIELAGKRIDLAGVVPQIERWRSEDAANRHPGGAPAIISDRSALIGWMLLRADNGPSLFTELGAIFWYRLTDDAREALGLAHVRDTGNDERDRRAWYERARNAIHRIVELMDAWPAKRQLMNREERERTISLRDKNLMRIKQERGVWFTNAMLEMTFQAQPRRLRRRFKGALTVDQTATRAPSQKKRRSRDKKTGLEVPLLDANGNEAHKYVMEIDADLYPLKSHGAPLLREDGKGHKDYGLMYMLSLVSQTNSRHDKSDNHPMLIMAASLNAPNKEIAEEATRAIKSIQDRGHRISRLTADLGYIGQGVARYQKPLRDLGVPILTEYKKNQKGVNDGVGGALQIEGDLYCCATPEPLRTATVDFDEHKIDEETRRARIDERLAHWRLRPKERPDKNGDQPMMCPAYGPSATVECPKVRGELHPKASKKKLRPVVRDSDLPESFDRVCTQTSILVTSDDLVEHRQVIDYGTREHALTYRQDRSQIESINAYLKLGPERLDDSGARRIRGLAGQQFAIAMALVSANLRRIARFLQKEAQKASGSPKPIAVRRRDREGLSDYVRKAYRLRELEAANALAELRAAEAREAAAEKKARREASRQAKLAPPPAK